MPDAAEFLSGFNLIQGHVFGNYILNSATSTHQSIKRYQEYYYQITIVFEKISEKASYEDLFHLVIKEINQEHIIYGIRNPYRCLIDYPVNGDITQDEAGNITFKLTGHSYRVH